MINNEALKAFKAAFHGGTPKSYDETIREGLAAAAPYLSARCALVVPEGWQLVPKVPTFEMAKAAIDLDPKSDLDAKYIAMLSAAPQAITKPIDVAAVPSHVIEVLHASLAFVEGFDGDEMQEGISALIQKLKTALSAEPAKGQLPQDVINLVIAAREAFDAGIFQGDEEFNLDNALEPFAECVPYANEPDHVAPCPLCQEADCDFDCDGVYDSKRLKNREAGE